MAGRVNNIQNAQFMKFFESFSFCIIRASFATTSNDQTLEIIIFKIFLYCVPKTNISELLDDLLDLLSDLLDS